MVPLPDTRDSLILQVRDPENRDAWEQFVSIYKPLIYRMARGRGMQHADGEDLTQQVLLNVARSVGDWKRTAPEIRFRHWLRRIASNAIVNALTRAPKITGTGGSAMLQLMQRTPDTDTGPEAEIEHEYQRQVYRRAAEFVRNSVQPDTWQTFVLAVIEDQPAPTVAGIMKTTIGNVHAVRSRIMRRLQAAVRQIEESDT